MSVGRLIGTHHVAINTGRACCVPTVSVCLSVFGRKQVDISEF